MSLAIVGGELGCRRPPCPKNVRNTPGPRRHGGWVGEGPPALRVPRVVRGGLSGRGGGGAAERRSGGAAGLPPVPSTGWCRAGECLPRRPRGFASPGSLRHGRPATGPDRVLSERRRRARVASDASSPAAPAPPPPSRPPPMPGPTPTPVRPRRRFRLRSLGPLRRQCHLRRLFARGACPATTCPDTTRERSEQHRYAEGSPRSRRTRPDAAAWRRLSTSRLYLRCGRRSGGRQTELWRSLLGAVPDQGQELVGSGDR